MYEMMVRYISRAVMCMCGEEVILQRLIHHKALKIVPKGTGSRTAGFIIHSQKKGELNVCYYAHKTTDI